MITSMRLAVHRRQYAAIDVAKLIFAVLVIAIHTDPLSSLSPIINYWLVSVPARLAVPFLTLRDLPVRSKPAHLAARNLSTMLYLSHGLLLICYAGVFSRVLPEHSLLRFLFVLIGSVILSCLLIRASRQYPLFRHLT